MPSLNPEQESNLRERGIERWRDWPEQLEQHPLIVDFYGNNIPPDLLDIPAIGLSIGGKGKNLLEGVLWGLPTPPGFIVTTKVWREYVLNGGHISSQTEDLILNQFGGLEEFTGQTLGDPDNPLFVSCRSGSRFSMPGSMVTILNIGLNDETVDALGEQIGSNNAWTSYYNLVKDFGIQLGVPPVLFDKLEVRLSATKRPHAESQELTNLAKDLFRSYTPSEFPQDPVKQIMIAQMIVFESWFDSAAATDRAMDNIEADAGTTAIFQQMVFGNQADGGSGVLLTADPKTFGPEPIVAYVPHVQGTEVVGDKAHPEQRLEDLPERLHDQLGEIIRIIKEYHPHFPIDVEFTDNGERVWVLQKRGAPLSNLAKFRRIEQLKAEGTSPDILARLMPPPALTSLLKPPLDQAEIHRAISEDRLLARGQSIVLGHAIAPIVFSLKDASAAPSNVCLVCPLDQAAIKHIPLNVVAIGALNGGIGGHIARLAERLGRDRQIPIIFAVDLTPDPINSGYLVTLDGTGGRIFKGKVGTQENNNNGLLTKEEIQTAQNRLEAYQQNPWKYITFEADRVKELTDKLTVEMDGIKARFQSHKAHEVALLRYLFPPNIRMDYQVIKPYETKLIRKMLAENLRDGNHHATVRTCPDHGIGGPWALVTSMDDIERLFNNPGYSKYGNYANMILPQIIDGHQRHITEVIVGKFPKDKMNTDPDIMRQHCTWTLTANTDGALVWQFRPHSFHLRTHDTVAADDIITYSTGPYSHPISSGDYSQSPKSLTVGSGLQNDRMAIDFVNLIISQVQGWRSEHMTIEKMAALADIFPSPEYGIPVMQGHARIYPDKEPWVLIYDLNIDPIKASI